MKTIVITGASSGIGYATAKALAKGNRLILCGRRTERLQQLQKELTDTSTLLLTFDVAKKEEVFAAFATLPEEWKNIDVLINNRSEEHTSELQSRPHLVCRLLLEKKKIEQLM